jgi:hypothetical protein
MAEIEPLNVGRRGRAAPDDVTMALVRGCFEIGG